MEEKTLPSYYSILPAVVRYDERLLPIQKVIFSEITALTNKLGYCYASNAHIADLYKMHETTVSKCISKLQNLGYVKVEVEQNNSRKIYITELGKVNGVSADTKGVRSTGQGGVRRTDQHNSTSTNTKYNNIVPTNKSLSLPESLGRTPIARLVKAYKLLWKDKLGVENSSLNQLTTNAVFKRLLGRFNEMQIASLLVIHFNWFGISGTDNYINKRMVDGGYPPYLIGRNADHYVAYLKNVAKMDINDMAEVKKHVKGFLKPLI